MSYPARAEGLGKYDKDSNIIHQKLLAIETIASWLTWGGVARGVPVLNCWIAASKEASLNSIHTIMFTFRLMPLERHEHPYPSSYGLNSITAVLQQGWLWNLMTHKRWYPIWLGLVWFDGISTIASYKYQI